MTGALRRDDLFAPPQVFAWRPPGREARRPQFLFAPAPPKKESSYDDARPSGD